MLLNKNEIGFIQLVKLLDSMIGAAIFLDETIELKRIPLVDLLEKDFRFKNYIYSPFNSEDELFKYLETIDIPKHINEEGEEAVEEYLIQKEIEFQMDIVFPKQLAYEFICDELDNMMGMSTVKTLYHKFTFDKDYNNDWCDKYILDYDKIKKILNGELKYINL